MRHCIYLSIKLQQMIIIKPLNSSKQIQLCVIILDIKDHIPDNLWNFGNQLTFNVFCHHFIFGQEFMFTS